MKSGIQGIIIAFLGTLLIFSLVRTDIYEKMPKFRFLSNRTMTEIREEMCSKSSSDLNNFYKKTGPNYDFNPPESKMLQNVIKNFVNSSSSQEIGKEEVEDYFGDRPLYIFILILFIMLILLWIPYILCVCCKCCCLVPESCLSCPKVYVFICLALCALALINCFIGYSYNGNIVDGVYGLGCTILKIEQHLLEGDEYKSEKPYWIGLQTILVKLQQTSANITNLQEKPHSIQQQFQNTVHLMVQEFHTNLTDEYDRRKDQKVFNPDPSNSNKIVPTYLNLYGPEDQKGTILNSIYSEIDELYSLSENGVDNITSIISSATNKTTEISETLNTTRRNVDDNIKNIDNSIASKINEYDDTFYLVESKARTYMNLFFSFNLIITIVVGVSLIFICLCNKGLLLLCLSWFALYIFMLLTFFLGALFGLIGSFIQDASSGIHYLINHLDEVGFEGQSKDIAEICLKGNGSLAQSSLIPDFDLSLIDNVYSLESFIDEVKKNISDYPPISIEEASKKYDELLKNKNQLIDVVDSLNKVRKLTDKNYDGHSVTNAPYADEWEISEKDCQYGVLDPDKVNQEGVLNEYENCLVITKWTRDQIEKRYEDFEPATIQNEVLLYYDSITEYMKDTEKLIEEVKAKNDEFRDSFKSICQKDIDLLNQTKEIIRPLRESYEEIVGDNSIFEILNCKFLKRDVNKIMQELYDSFGVSFLNISTLFILISVSELCMTFFILLIMKAFGNKIKSEDIEKV